MGPGNHTAYTPHCLRRDFSPLVFSETLNQSVQDWTLTAPDFWHVDRWIQGLSLSISGLRTHAGGHLSVGGQIGEVFVASYAFNPYHTHTKDTWLTSLVYCADVQLVLLARGSNFLPSPRRTGLAMVEMAASR